jgi:hypothetical protein
MLLGARAPISGKSFSAGTLGSGSPSDSTLSFGCSALTKHALEPTSRMHNSEVRAKHSVVLVESELFRLQSCALQAPRWFFERANGELPS